MEQSLDLAAECNAAWRLGEVKRLDTESVAGDGEGCRPRIPNTNGENAVEPREHLRPMLEIHVQQNFCVRMAPESVAPSLQLSPKFTIVVNLAVEDKLCARCRVNHRLVAKRREIDNGESRMGEPHVFRRIYPQSTVIWPPVAHNL